MKTAPKRAFQATRIIIMLAAAVFGLWVVGSYDLWAQDVKLILSLGDDSYIPWLEVEAQTGAVIKRDPGESPLRDFSVIILSNIGYATLPEVVRTGLPEYLERGGSILVTGGQQSYGSGGYANTELAELLPLRPSRDDWLPHPFGPTLIFQPGHPILRGIVIPTMAFFNELDLNGGAVEIAQYRKASKAGIGGGRIPGSGGLDPGGGEIQGGGRRPMPLIAERTGGGTILAIALDMTLTGDWKDRSRFAQNCVEYLLQRSQIEPPQKQSTLHKGPGTCCAT